MMTVVLSLAKDMLSYRNVALLELAFFRSLCNTLFSAILVKLVYNEPFFIGIPRDLRMPLFIRCFTGLIGFICYTAAPVFLPLGILQVVISFGLFSTAVWADCWLGERITIFELGAMVVTVGGVILLGMSKEEAEVE